MMDPQPIDDRVDAALSRILGGTSRNGNQSVTVKFEGRGLGIAGACAIICVVCCFFLSGLLWSQADDIRDIRRDNQRLNDYLAAIYAQAPHLKPKEQQ